MDQIPETQQKGWWDTAIIRVRPNELRIRGYALDELMGRVTFGEMAYLMIMGELPSRSEITGLLDALLVAVCDHGANSPAVATSIMAATCGIPLNCVMASGMNLLGEIHGGPIEAATRLFYRTDQIIQESGRPPEDVMQEICEEFHAARRFMPGFGHPVHNRDPRVVRLFELIEEAQEAGAISGRFMRWARMFEQILPQVFSKAKIPLNVDGGGAVVLCDTGIPAETAMGFVCLSRGLGLMAHGFETQRRKERLKAPMPPDLIAEHMTYSGPSPRKLPVSRREGRPKFKRR
ncbi:MAG: citryl-CoA lyase [Desulfobacterales bacterium]|nr:MAG: citryl-CoA lyase [Desulfobacterales bacterium]